ncbi:hypothetical protein [Myxococcus qinghaiensis]|uniref:hypothetical protein n=1 Tax=Myxococcus qinghaiensis TaxID=2906758 RepID=UPI0020A761F8|nr:hypothetical protein [Myxococcus qinghaiensis]MCP3163163.1 hypothetical protein [Myxococcus qinghaiensis]
MNSPTTHQSSKCWHTPLPRTLTILATATLAASCLGSRATSTPIASTTPPRADVAEDGKLEYLSDTDPGYSLLEALQRAAYQNTPHAFRWTNDPAELAKLANLLKTLDKRPTLFNNAHISPPKDPDNTFISNLSTIKASLGEKLPTRYEDAVSIWILRNVVQWLDAQLSAKSSEWRSPRIGTLPLGTLQAQAIPLPEPEPYLIVVNSSLFSLCNELTKIGLMSVQFAPAGDGHFSIDFSEETFNKGPRRDPELLRRFSMALEDIVNNRRVRGHFPPDRLHDKVVGTMVNAMETFIVGHEFGHAYLKHKNSGLTPLPLGIPDSSAEKNIHVIHRNWGQEAAADVFGYMLTGDLIREKSAVAKNKDDADLSQLGMLGPILYFEIAEIAEEAQHIHKNATFPPEPSASERATTLKALTEALLAGSAGNDSSDSKHAQSEPDNETQQARQQPTPPPAGMSASHAPYWARGMLARAQWETSLPKTMTPEDRAFSLLGIAMVKNLRTMWEDIKPAWVSIMKQKAKQ